jgi:transcriptional regulator with XRE-family HTH domain
VLTIWNQAKKISLSEIVSLASPDVNYLGECLAAVMGSHGLTAIDLAQLTGISRPTMSRIVNSQRLTPDALRALCTQLPWVEDSLDILVAHLRDEITRSGRMQADIILGRSKDPLSTIEGLSEDIRLLADSYLHDEDLQSILKTMAAMIRRDRLRTGFDNARAHDEDKGE